MKQTSKQRAKALLRFKDDINLNYGVWGARPNLSIVESAVHELAHGVSLRMRFGSPPTRFLRRLSARISARIDSFSCTDGNFDYQRADREEDRALAIEWLVLRELGLRIGQRVVEAAAYRDSQEATGRVKVVKALTHRPRVQRCARRVLRILDAICAAI